MASDVRLDDPADGWVTIDGQWTRLLGADLMIDHAGRRDGAGGSYRRALVHGPDDTLVVNWGNDYTGGVVLNRARFRVLEQEGEPQLPKEGETGEIIATLTVNRIGNDVVNRTVTLWLCIGVPGSSAVGRALGGVHWVPLQTGESVRGTL